MENVLVVDTSNNYMSVIVIKGEEVFSTFTPDCAMKHSVLLMPKIEETLEKAGIGIEECAVFGAVVGAGSFTGIRIGVSAMKGFALATQKPTLPITSFDMIAYNAIDEGKKVLCLVDALHDCYYACGYAEGMQTLAPAYVTEEEVLALVNEGYALQSCMPLPIADKTPLSVIDPIAGLTRAAERLIQQAAFGELNALYVRKSSAEENAKV